MVAIITSKTRRRSPHGKTVVVEHPSGENRITDERGAEKLLRRGSEWRDPQVIPGARDRTF